jgi:hypothetical protein
MVCISALCIPRVVKMVRDIGTTRARISILHRRTSCSVYRSSGGGHGTSSDQMPLSASLQEVSASREFRMCQQVMLIEVVENGMSMALTMALYMITCKELGVVPEFPGNRFFYNSTDDCSYAPAIADLSVWSATQAHTKNEAFNHVNGDTIVWRYHFKQLGEYFGIDVCQMLLFPS